jgi:hypothetical protein
MEPLCLMVLGFSDSTKDFTSLREEKVVEIT